MKTVITTLVTVLVGALGATTVTLLNLGLGDVRGWELYGLCLFAGFWVGAYLSLTWPDRRPYLVDYLVHHAAGTISWSIFMYFLMLI